MLIFDYLKLGNYAYRLPPKNITIVGTENGARVCIMKSKDFVYLGAYVT